LLNGGGVMKKYEVYVAVNRCSGYEIYQVEAASEREASENYHSGTFVEYQDLEPYWDTSYGREPAPLVEEVKESEVK